MTKEGRKFLEICDDKLLDLCSGPADLEMFLKRANLVLKKRQVEALEEIASELTRIREIR